MTTEICKTCNQESTPWVHINGHICQDCYENTKRLWNKNSNWISVKDRLPNDGEEVVIFNIYDDSHISIGYRKDGKFFDLIDFSMEPCGVTHWMPLPEAPK